MAACSFCEKPDTEVKLLIAGLAGAVICDECARGAREIIAEGETEEAKPPEPEPRRARVLRMADYAPSESR